MSDAPTRRVAAFDFDGTLSRRDTLIPFLARAGGRARFARAAARLGLLGARQELALSDRDAAKAELMRLLFTGRADKAMRWQGEQYARELAAVQLRPEVLERLEQHRAAGHETLFVSASLTYYLRPLAAVLGMDDVIAVEPEVVDGVLTGELTHPNVRAEQKAVRLREWLGAPSEGPLSGVELWAYGNSSGDHELLELADHRYWMGPARSMPPGVEHFVPSPEPFDGARP